CRVDLRPSDSGCSGAGRVDKLPMYTSKTLAAATLAFFGVVPDACADITVSPSLTPISTATPPSQSSNSYSTNFPKIENPISENGKFITSTTPGVNWSGLRLGGCGCKSVSPVAI